MVLSCCSVTTSVIVSVAATDLYGFSETNFKKTKPKNQKQNIFTFSQPFIKIGFWSQKLSQWVPVGWHGGRAGKY